MVSDLKYAVEQRLRFIDFLVAHYGTVNRAALVDYFGISMPCASGDLSEYQEFAPNNIVYDKKAKAYVRSTNFKRVWA
ncbi:hypothetical protein [Paraburkholderia tropica]|uniref:hypothetical protein n=1 Tax=Paraburkholderia tropica TaxID=92647 RepID=UPI002AB6960A|nr:hypothetical protein [Paraburkholderia tropica]